MTIRVEQKIKSEDKAIPIFIFVSRLRGLGYQ